MDQMEKAGDNLNLSFLLEHEREMILKVLQKDEKLRKREEKRIRKLKNDLLEIKRKGSRPPQDSEERQCARCLKTLGLIFDRGDLCEECQLRVCSECRASAAGSRKWKCNVCAKISELKVVTGEWFLEERSRRFEEKALSSDVIKQSILSTPPTAENKSTENLSASSEPEKPDTPKSNRNAVRNIMDGARKKGRMKIGKKGSRATLKPGNGVDSASMKSSSDGETQSVRSAQSHHSNRSVSVALESSGLSTVPNNLRSQTPDKSPNPSNNRRVRPDGAESVSSVHTSEGLPEKEATGHHRTNLDTPTICVSRASVSSDHSRSEMDLSAPGSEHSDDALSLRSRSVSGFNEAEFSDDDAEEDIDALMSAHSLSRGGRLSNTASTSSTPCTERRWGYLNVPDSDAETVSLLVSHVCMLLFFLLH
ncbi:hypothetical protein GOODEAATRI_014926 [Goodea atripinnis]|uniref:RabBD domain-containing protein n=1 Tax=Goodea atripinnis TaxID=208336 RepID=A0ABV0N1I6_9TELE